MRLILTAIVCALTIGCGGAKEEPAPKKTAEAKPKTKAPKTDTTTKKVAETKVAPETAKAPAPAKAPEPASKTGAAGGAAAAVTDDGKVVTVALTGNDQMKYNLSEIKVATGRTVKLTLTHTGKMPAAAMGHNFVLLKAGTDVQAFATKAVSAAATAYIPADMKGSVLANTKVVGGGEKDTIEFTAPAPGTYDYICTFPGHYAIMKGKLVVQ